MATKEEKVILNAEADLVKVAALEAEKKAEDAVKKTVKKAEPIKKAADEKKAETKKKVEADKKKVEAKVAADKKKVETKVAADKKAVEAKAEKAEKAVKKTVKKAAEKVAVSEVVYVQYAEGETTIADITKKVKDQFVAEGHRASSIKSVRIYVKPEERAAYYVINDANAGRVDLF